MHRQVLQSSTTHAIRALFSFEQALLLLPAKKLTMSPAALVRPLSSPQLSLRSCRPGQARGRAGFRGNMGPMLYESTVSKIP